MAQPKNQQANNTATTIGIIVVILLAILAGVYFMDANRNDGDINDTRLENAIDEFSDNAERGRIGEGAEEASEELRDRSTGEKVGDAIEDAGRDIQDAANDARN